MGCGALQNSRTAPSDLATIFAGIQLQNFSGEEGVAQMAEDESEGGEWLLQVGLTCP